MASAYIAMRGGLRKGAWTEEEDSLLRKCIEKYGEGKWHQVPRRAGLNRCRKSCRLRWLNYLRPNIKRGNFGLDEVDLIIRLHKLLGNRWALIAGRLPGRTANDVKNYWNTYIRKRVADGGTQEADLGRPQAKNINDSKISTAEEPKTTASNIIKPRPRTFSKNAPWLRHNYAQMTSSNTINYNDQNSGGSVPNSQSVEDHDHMQWLENLLTDKEMMSDEGPFWPFSDFGDERIAATPWSQEIWSGSKEDGNCTQDGQNYDFSDFCINDADLL